MTPGSTTLGDYMTGLYGCLGVLMALRHRDLTGEGRYVDAALYESVFRCTEKRAPTFGMYGMVRERAGSSHNDFAVPHGHFSTKDGKWVAIRCATDLLFDRLAKAMARPELATADTYGEQKIRLAHRHDVNEIVRDWCGALALEEVLERCYATDTGEQVIVPAPVPRLSETPGRIRTLGPKLGEHSSELLHELPGLDEARSTALRAKNAI